MEKVIVTTGLLGRNGQRKRSTLTLGALSVGNKEFHYFFPSSNIFMHFRVSAARFIRKSQAGKPFSLCCQQIVDKTLIMRYF